MSSAQPSIRRTQDQLARVTLSDTRRTQILAQSGYYDPDSAAYDDELADLSLPVGADVEWSETRELVPA